MGGAKRQLVAEAALSPGASREAIGGYLARQRRLRGIGLDELARATRVPRRSLERLESGAFDENPDGFARGFVRTVAAALGLDPDETVARMLAEPSLACGPALRPRLEGGRHLPVRWLLGVAAGLAVAALVWWAWPSKPASSPTDGIVYRHDAVGDLARQVARGQYPVLEASKARSEAKPSEGPRTGSQDANSTHAPP